MCSEAEVTSPRHVAERSSRSLDNTLSNRRCRIEPERTASPGSTLRGQIAWARGCGAIAKLFRKALELAVFRLCNSQEQGKQPGYLKHVILAKVTESSADFFTRNGLQLVKHNLGYGMQTIDFRRNNLQAKKREITQFAGYRQDSYRRMLRE